MMRTYGELLLPNVTDVTKGQSTLPAGAITDPDTGLGITDPDDGLFITDPDA